MKLSVRVWRSRSRSISPQTSGSTACSEASPLLGVAMDMPAVVYFVQWPRDEQTKESGLAQTPGQGQKARREAAHRRDRPPRLGEQRETAVDDDGLAADHRGGGRTQKRHDARDIFGRRHPALGRPLDRRGNDFGTPIE